MSNGLIDLEETGVCSTRSCSNVGKRARGARDIEAASIKTGVFVKSFYCDDCLAGAAQRSLVNFSSVQKIRRPGGLPPGITRFERIG